MPSLGQNSERGQAGWDGGRLERKAERHSEQKNLFIQDKSRREAKRFSFPKTTDFV